MNTRKTGPVLTQKHVGALDATKDKKNSGDPYEDGIKLVTQANDLLQKENLDEAETSYLEAIRLLGDVVTNSPIPVISIQTKPLIQQPVDKKRLQAIAAKENIKRCEEKIELIRQLREQNLNLFGGVFAKLCTLESLSGKDVDGLREKAFLELGVKPEHKGEVIKRAKEALELLKKEKDSDFVVTAEYIENLQQYGFYESSAKYRGKSTLELANEIQQKFASVQSEQSTKSTRETKEDKIKSYDGKRTIQAYIKEINKKTASKEQDSSKTVDNVLALQPLKDSQDPICKLIESLLRDKVITSKEEALAIALVARDQELAVSASSLDFSVSSEFTDDIISAIEGPKLEDSYTNRAANELCKYLDYLIEGNSGTFESFCVTKGLAHQKRSILRKINEITTDPAPDERDRLKQSAMATSKLIICLIDKAYTEGAIKENTKLFLKELILHYSEVKGDCENVDKNKLNEALKAIKDLFEKRYLNLKTKVRIHLTNPLEQSHGSDLFEATSEIHNLSKFLNIASVDILKYLYKRDVRKIQKDITPVGLTLGKRENDTKSEDKKKDLGFVTLQDKQKIRDILPNSSTERGIIEAYLTSLAKGILPTRANFEDSNSTALIGKSGFQLFFFPDNLQYLDKAYAELCKGFKLEDSTTNKTTNFERLSNTINVNDQERVDFALFLACEVDLINQVSNLNSAVKKVLDTIQAEAAIYFNEKTKKPEEPSQINDPTETNGSPEEEPVIVFINCEPIEQLARNLEVTFTEGQLPTIEELRRAYGNANPANRMRYLDALNTVIMQAIPVTVKLNTGREIEHQLNPNAYDELVTRVKNKEVN